MILEYSKIGIPSIYLDDINRISFCKTTSNDKVYKHLIMKITVKYNVKLNGNSAVRMHDVFNYMTNIKMSKIPRIVKNNPLYKSMILDIKDIIKKYINSDGNFPKNKIDNLSKDIVSFNNGDYLND